MALLEDIIREVPDGRLRERLLGEVRKLKADKKFGLVYEDHLPEVVPLFGTFIRKGTSVARKVGPLGEVYRVTALRGGVATCQPETPTGGAAVDIPVAELVAVKRFGEPIFPTLTEVDSVTHPFAKDVPAHVLIEADNYHALQLLAYAHAGQVDCIYIDPPYNTGARDWKYNNDYVDGADGWRHSKWLAFMEKRLRLAKQLLKPDTGVLIVTIDRNELHHLGMLLGEVIPEASRQIVTICINPSGSSGEGLSRVEEYALFCFLGGTQPVPTLDDLLSRNTDYKAPTVGWESLLRRGNVWYRKARANLCYPVILSKDEKRIIGVGQPLEFLNDAVADQVIEENRPLTKDGHPLAWPVRSDGRLGIWRVEGKKLAALLAQGFAYVTNRDEKRGTWSMKYLMEGSVKAVANGEIQIIGTGAYGEKLLRRIDRNRQVAKTMWNRGRHIAGGAGGTKLLVDVLGKRNIFSFPKSVYAVRDALEVAVGNRREALIIDFFSGSGTTLNAVNLLNAVDGGHRRCIMVTNNEVSADESDILTAQGHQPGSEEWEQLGICRSVTWPRSKYTIEGKRSDGTPLPGEYLTGKMVDREVARQFTHVGFADQFGLDVVRKKQLVAMIDGLPQNLVKNEACPFIVSSEHSVSILFETTAELEWLEALEGQEHVYEFYIVAAYKRDFDKLKRDVIDMLGARVVPEEEKRPFSSGFSATARYFKLDFLDPTSVEIGRAFDKLLPTLWLMAGGFGQVPADAGDDAPYLVAPESRLAVLRHTTSFNDFVATLASTPIVLNKVFLVTDSSDEFYTMQAQLRLMLPALPATACVQLYRNYLDNFRINTGDAGASTTIV